MKIRLAIALIALFIMGIVMTISGVSNLIKLGGNVPDFNYESMQNIKKGDFVQGYIWNIDGCYAYTTTTNTKYGIEMNSYTSAEYFLMPLVNDSDLAANMYITVVASKKADRELLYDINDATWEYYGGNVDVVFPEMGIVAKVNELEPEYESYLVETMLEAEYFATSAEARSHIYPYTLTVYNPSSAYTSLGIGLVIVILFIVVGLLLYSKYKKDRDGEFIPAPQTSANNFSAENTYHANGFTENYTPPQPVPMPDIPQPADADEFFARTPKVSAPVVEETPKEEPVASVEAEAVPGNMDELDTTGLFDDADYEIEENEFIE